MDRQKSSGLTKADEKRLISAMAATKDKRTYTRLQAVLMIAQGTDVPSIAKSILKSRRVIYKWLQTYLQTHKPSDLFEASRSGRPAVAPSITDKRILTALNRHPVSCGYRANSWTVDMLSDYLSQRYRCPIGPHTLRRRMKAIGLRYKRPRYVYGEKDPNRAQKKGRLSEN